MKCPRCQQDNPSHANFCVACGVPLKRTKESDTPREPYAELQRALAEALEQQTATSEVLRAISQSSTDLQPVFDIIAASALRLCGGGHSGVWLYDGDLIHLAALDNVTPEEGEAIRRHFPRRADNSSATGRAVLTCALVQVPDILQDPAYALKSQDWVFRSFLSAPMLRDGKPVGAIGVGRHEPGRFSDKLVQLLKTFADQAVIAIENVRLFKDLETRNRELTKALEQQVATAQILRVISSSPIDMQPIFDAIIASAVRLCNAQFGWLHRFDGEMVHFVAHRGLSPEALAVVQRAYPMRPDRTQATGRAILVRNVVVIEDQLADPEYRQDFAAAEQTRSALAVPMLRDGEPLGVIVIKRTESGPFPDEQIALLQTFADQAVIAIENGRLLSELQARTAELTRSVDELTALGDVGRALSSTLDLETVLQTIVLRANELAGTAGCTIWEYDAPHAEFRLLTSRYADKGDAALLQTPGRVTTIPRGQGVTTQVMERRQPVQIRDITTARDYESPIRRQLVDAGHRALLGVPLLSEDEVIGVLAVTRKTPGEFAPEIVRLLSTFATQSALAIQNARLFLEIEDKSRQLEVASQHKSEFLANMSHELRTPLNAILGFSEVLAEGMFGEINDKQAEYLRDILESGRHLLSLINDILDLSKIEAGRMELELSDFDLPSAIDNALTLVRERAARRGITLGRAIDKGVGAIRADERKVKQVVLNLLSNAIKFTPEGGRIDVRAGVSEGLVEVAVADTGVGIAPEHQETVFEEFRQVGTADKNVEGTGLGLALSRKFVELHGGRIEVTSKLGEGSTFTFTLPMRRGE